MISKQDKATIVDIARRYDVGMKKTDKSDSIEL